MRRAPIVIGATAAGLAGVLSFHTKATSFSALGTGTQAQGRSGSSGPTGSSGAPASGSPGSSSTAPSGTARSAPRPGSSSGPTAPGASSGGASSGSSSAAPASAGSTPGSTGARSSGTTPSAPATVKLTGKVVQFGYGQLAVTVTLRGSRITSSSVTSLQVADPTSGYIAQQAVPYLQREVMQAQSAKIQGVSGATYTSEAYAMSLQSALAKRPKG